MGNVWHSTTCWFSLDPFASKSVPAMGVTAAHVIYSRGQITLNISFIPSGESQTGGVSNHVNVKAPITNKKATVQ